jgi:phosphoglycolate phosphatase
VPITLNIYQKITTELVNKGKRVIGINGVDTSGKSVFAAEYSQFLTSRGIKNQIIHIDDFHNPREIRLTGANEIDAYYENAFNYKQIIDEILEPMKNGEVIDKDVLCLNLDTDKYENLIHYTIDRETIVLLEGTLLFRPPLNKYIDAKIFLHVDFEEVLKRAAICDVPKYGQAFLEKYRLKYIPIQKRYLQEHKPQEQCDILIDNNDYNNPKHIRGL